MLAGVGATLPFGLYYYSGRICELLSWQTAASLYLYPLNKVPPQLSLYEWEPDDDSVLVLQMFQTCAVWTHMAIAFERYLAVVHPFRFSCFVSIFPGC